MMKLNNVDIVFVEETGNGMRAFNLPGTLLVGLSLVAFCLALFLTWMLLDYRDLKPRTAELYKAEAFQAQQKKQIAYLQHRIRTVQEKVKELESCDFKLRAVAHISAGEEGRSLVQPGRRIQRVGNRCRHCDGPYDPGRGIGRGFHLLDHCL